MCVAVVWLCVDGCDDYLTLIYFMSYVRLMLCVIANGMPRHDKRIVTYVESLGKTKPGLLDSRDDDYTLT